MALIETLQDNFDDSTRDDSLWSAFGLGYNETNRELWFESQLTAQYAGYESRSTYDLTASSIKIEVVYINRSEVINITSLEIFPILVRQNSTNYYSFLINSSGNLLAYKKVAGVGATVASTTFNLNTHKWLRIREDSGTTYWDYSTDGTTWSNLGSEATAITITALSVELQVGTYAVETTQTTIILDNLNTTHVDRSSDNPRKVIQNTQVSWKRDFATGAIPFTIGTSLIGSVDFIGSDSGSAISAWNQYNYFDESQYVEGLSWERTLQLPVGGISIARANVQLDNTSGRFLPSSMQGNSELFTAILPQRPIKIFPGFHYDNTDNYEEAFVGILDKSPKVDLREKQAELSAVDFLGFLENKRIDDTTIYTGQRVDQIIEDILSNKFGLSTAQYELDTGIESIPFAAIESGTRYTDFINQITQAEMGHVIQDEAGIIHFWNRQKWSTLPYNLVQEIVYTADVLNVEAPDDDHIVNVVEVRATPREKTSGATLFTLGAPIELAPGSNDVWVDFDNPVIQAGTPTRTANSAEDGSGSNDTSSVTLTSSSVFIRTAKYVYNNATGRVSYLTALSVTGTWATVVDEIYRTGQDDSSVTAYDEKVLSIQNDFIQSNTWANSYIQLVLSQLAEPEYLLKMTIRAKPHLSLGTLISWQGHYWRIFGMKTSMNPSIGFVQELDLVQRTDISYFTIGISQVGGSDAIAP